MGYYRHMGSMEQHLGGNAAPSTLLHYHLRDLWKSSRGAVIRIEAFSLVAIFLSFIVVAFGTCRRWSKNWIVQKGFLAAQVLSLSLGTYSIGLMQSSPVKSEMYPIWAVSLLTLFGYVDPVTTYNGLNYKGPLTKTIFQLCVYCGYVLLLISSISGVFDNLALSVLSAVTFVKGFHRSMALVLPSRTRDQIEELDSTEPSALAGDGMELKVHVSIPRYMRRGRTIKKWYQRTSMAEIYSTWNIMPSELGLASTSSSITDIEDVCLGYSLSHLLRRRFLGLDTAREMKEKREQFENLVRDGKDIAYNRTLKAIEVELAFLYEVLFTSNEFLHYHEAKTSSFWALASFIGICFVGVAVAIPGTTDSHKQPIIIFSGSSASVVVVHTTAADLMTTLVILVSLAVLQLVQLIRCWTSNWARVLFASEYVSSRKAKIAQQGRFEAIGPKISTSWWLWMRLKAFVVTRMNWFDNKYLWQDKLGQYSLVDDTWSHTGGWRLRIPLLVLTCVCMPEMCGCLGRLLGLQYIGQVLRELWVTDSNTGPAIRLHEDMKVPITRFLHQIKSRRMSVEDWSSWFVHNGIEFEDLTFNNAPLLDQSHQTAMSEAYAFTHRVMMWHAATCYCQVLAEQDAETGGEAGRSSSESEKNRRVAMALYKYCAYLVVSAPELLPGPSAETKRAHKDALERTKAALYHKKDPADLVTVDGRLVGRYERKASTLQESMLSTGVMLKEKQKKALQESKSVAVSGDYEPHPGDAYLMGVHLGMKLINESETRTYPDHWEVLARLWVQTLVYAAPYGDTQSHLQHLSQGGEFITHLWALLYHIGIDSWEREPHQSAGAAPSPGSAPNLSTEADIEELN